MSKEENKLEVTSSEIRYQLWKELRFAFCCALGYVLIKVFTHFFGGDDALKNYFNWLEWFTASFFVVGSFTGQWVRVKKQLTVEKNFNKAEDKMIALADKVEEKTTDLINHITGGNSYFYYKPNQTEDKNFSFEVVYVGKYGLSNINVKVYNQSPESEWLTKGIPNINPDTCDRGTIDLNIFRDNEVKGSFNIQFSANNSTWIQVFNYTLEKESLIIKSDVWFGKSNYNHAELQLKLSEKQMPGSEWSFH